MAVHHQQSTTVDGKIRAREQAELEVTLYLSLQQLQVDGQRSSTRRLCSGNGKCAMGTCDTCMEAAGPEMRTHDMASSEEDPFIYAQAYVDLFGNRVWFEPEPNPYSVRARAIRRLQHERNGITASSESSKAAPTWKQYMEYSRANYPSGWKQYQAITFPPSWGDTVHYTLKSAQIEAEKTLARKRTRPCHTKEQHALHRPRLSDQRQPIEEASMKPSLKDDDRGDKRNSKVTLTDRLLCPETSSTSSLGTSPDTNLARHTRCELPLPEVGEALRPRPTNDREQKASVTGRAGDQGQQKEWHRTPQQLTPDSSIKARPDSGYGSQSTAEWAHSYGTRRSASCAEVYPITGHTRQQRKEATPRNSGNRCRSWSDGRC